MASLPFDPSKPQAQQTFIESFYYVRHSYAKLDAPVVTYDLQTRGNRFDRGARIKVQFAIAKLLHMLQSTQPTDYLQELAVPKREGIHTLYVLEPEATLRCRIEPNGS